MSSTVMFLFLEMQGFLNLILNRTVEQPTCYSSLSFLLTLLFWEAHHKCAGYVCVNMEFIF